MTGPPPPVLAIWAVLALVALVAIVLGIRAEDRWFSARNKGRPWLALRICTIPIAAATAGLLLLATRSVGGPEALLVFYLSLFTAAPLIYFALHWLVGRWLQAALTNGESAWIGFSGLMVVIGPAAFASADHPWVFVLARSFGGA